MAYKLNELGYPVLEPVQLVVRYEEWVPNRHNSDGLEIWTLGGNYFFDPRYSKIQLNGMLVDGKGNIEDGSGITFGWEVK